jgi:arabinofuranosyltransferase
MRAMNFTSGGRQAYDVRLIGLAVLLLAIAVAAMVLIARSYLPFVADDSLISFRYSQRLLGGHGLTFTDGERVEGYSNFLWVLLVAAGGLVTSDLIQVGRVLGTVCTALALAAIVWACPPRSARAALAAGAGLVALALSHGVGIWAIGGLEQALQIALLAWALAVVGFTTEQAAEMPPAAGVLLALLVLTRPDGVLFCALIAVGLIAVHGLSGQTVRGILRLVWLPAIAWIGQEIFRLTYYGDWVPNTAYAKLSGSARHFAEGALYLANAVLWHAPVIVLAGISLAIVRPLRRRDVLIPLIVAIGWCVYVASIGGDIFPGRRHFLPALVCLAFVIVATWRRSEASRLSPIALAALLAVATAGYLPLQRVDVENERAKGEQWEWDCGKLMTDLRVAFQAQRPLLAADATGCTAYFSEFPMLDMLGLNDRYLAHHPPPDFGTGFIGHELGDGTYVLSRQPDIILFGIIGHQPWWRSGLEMVKLPDFARDYALVNLRVFGLQPLKIWFRWASPRIGVSRSAQEIRVPGYLFATSGSAAARLQYGRIVAHIGAGETVTFDRVPLEPAGTWTAQVKATGPVSVAVEGSVVKVTAGANDCDLAEVVLTSPYSTAGLRASAPR